jgi:hypothetical protein
MTTPSLLISVRRAIVTALIIVNQGFSFLQRRHDKFDGLIV